MWRQLLGVTPDARPEPWRRAVSLGGLSLVGLAGVVSGCAQDATGTVFVGDGVTGGAAGSTGGARTGGFGGSAAGGTGTGGVIAAGAGGTAVDAGPVCTPGAERACQCTGLDGNPAIQRCLGDGSGYVPCVCKTQVCVPGTTMQCGGGTETCLGDGSGYGRCLVGSIECPGVGTCQGGALGATLQPCCLPGGQCGLDLTPAHNLVGAIPATCTALSQAGPADATCPTRSLVFPAGAKDLAGCCRPDGTCGIAATFGTTDFGCVEPTLWGFPAGGACGAQPTCTDGIKNGSEADVDCGHVCPTACAPGKLCQQASDCASFVCGSGVCVAPTCSDLIRNGDETGVDCGGTKCPACAACACASNGDCSSNHCDSCQCLAATCSDGITNGSETDTDCGGSCPGCAAGAHCADGADCVSQVCTSNVCQGP